VLSVNNLSLDIGRKSVLKNIQFDLHTGEHLVILGANGAGKSTLLKTVAGDRLDHRGDILFNQQRLDAIHRKTLARMRAVMPQDTQLSFPFLAREVVEMGSTPFGNGPEEAAIAQQCLALFEVEHLADRRYPQLSGGEQQRIQLARVFSQIWPRQDKEPPRYFFLDECSSALDPCHQIHVFNTVKKVCAMNVGVLSIMHDINLAAECADRILLMQSGRLIAEGPPENVLTEGLLKKAYGIHTRIIRHPIHGGPLVLNNGAAA